MDEESVDISLNIAIPSDEAVGRSKKKSTKQRKVEYELKRASKRKKRREEKKEKNADTTKPKVNKSLEEKKQEKSTRVRKEESGYTNSILRGESLPTVYSNEGNLYFPNLKPKKITDAHISKEKRVFKHKRKEINVDEKSEGMKSGAHFENFTKEPKVPNLQEDNNASTNGNDFASFIKKTKGNEEDEKSNNSKALGKFLRKSKKLSTISQGPPRSRQGELAMLFAKNSERYSNTTEKTVDFMDDEEVASKPKAKFSDGFARNRDRRPGKEQQEHPSVSSWSKPTERRAKEIGDAAQGDGADRGDDQPRNRKSEEPSAWRGKISSLFVNNPEIPNVARRAVRPVQEPVFSNENFTDLPIHKFSVSNLSALGLTRLTTVQRKAAPVLLEGRDALVRSQTGSGKTLAYAVPLVELLQRRRPELTRADGVRALVVLPTRELALQTYEWLLKLVKPFMRLVPGCLVGGEKRKSEKARLRKGITILVGTPGRILDHVQHTRSLRLDRVEHLVLDEADRMLDMGYERDIASLVAELDSQSAPLLPKEALEWNRKTHGLEQDQSTGENEPGKNKVPGYTSQDSGAGEEETSDASDEAEKEDNDKQKKASERRMEIDRKLKQRREEDETSDYDPEERADEVVEMKELETDEESTDDEEDEEDEEDEMEENSNHPGAGAPQQQPQQRKEAARRQTVLLSATLTPAVERLAGLALRSPAFVDAADVDAASAATDVVIPDSLTQWHMVVPAKLRLVTLAAFIAWKCKLSEERKMLLFCATQDMVNYLTELLTVGLSRADDGEDDDDPEEKFNVGVDFFRLHGDMDQKERTQVFQTFRAAKCGVLLCTDVAARGLDMPHVDWIVQYTAPGSVADYVHRVGRTARVGAQGSALLLLQPAEADFVQMLQDRRIRLQEEKMDTCLRKLALAVGSHDSRQRHSRSVEAAATALQLRFENAVLDRRSLHDFAVKAYISYVRFYASYPLEVRDVFGFKALHLGHHAKSFALRDPPSTIAGIGRRRFFEAQKDQRGAGKWPKQHDGGHRRSGPKGFKESTRKRTRDLVLSEFASGLEPSKKRKKNEEFG